MNIGEAVIDVVLDLRRMAVALKAMRLKVAKEMRRAGEMGKRAFAEGLRGIAKAAKWAALGVAGVTAAMAAGAGVALHASNQLNEAMANVASLGTEAAAHVGEWKGELQNLSVQMGKTTDDLAGGLYQVVSAFGAADDTMQILAINAKAATAGLAQTTDAINLTSAVTKAYGDTSAKAVQQVADLALKTVQLGQTTFPELAQSIGRVTPLAASLGLSMQDLFAVMATATGVTGNAAEVSTQMRSALSALMAPTDTLAKLYKKLGYANGQAMLKALGFGGTMRAIVEAAKKSGRPLQDYIGQVRGQTLALALANGLSEQYTEKLHEMAHAAGATDEAFRAQTQGIAGVAFRLKQLKQRAVVFVQKVGDAVAPLLGLVLDMFVPAFDKAAKAVEAVVTAFHDMLTGSKSFAEIHDSLTRVFGDELGSKIFGFLDGIRQLVDGLRNGGLMGDRFRDALERVAGSGAVEAFDNIVAAVGAAKEKLVQLWNTAGPFITQTVIPFVKEHGPAIVAAIGAIGAALAAAALVSTIAGIAAAVASLANPVTAVLALVGLLAAAWVEDWGGIREKTEVVVGSIVEKVRAMKQVLALLRQKVDKVIEKFARVKRVLASLWRGEALKPVRQYLHAMFSLFAAVWKGIGSLVEGIWGRINGWFRQNGSLISEYLSTVLGDVQSIVKAIVWVVSRAVGVVAWAVMNVARVFVWVGGVVAGVFARQIAPIFAIIRPLALGLVDEILGLAKMSMQVVTGDWAGAWETLKSTAVGALGAVGQAVTALLEWIASWFGTSLAEIGSIWRSNWAMLKTIVKTVLHEAANAVRAKWDEIKTNTITRITDTVTKAKEKWDEMKTSLATVLQGMVKAAKDKVEAIYQAGVDFIMGFWDGLKAKWEAVKAWVNEHFGWILSLVRSIYDSHSPSRAMMQIGADIMSGLRLGLEQAYKQTDWARYFDLGGATRYQQGIDALVAMKAAPMNGYGRQVTQTENITIHASGLDAEALLNLLYAQRVLRVMELPG